MREVMINGRAVSRVTLGGAVLWEKGGKEYAYYFNGEGATAEFDAVAVSGAGASLTVSCKPVGGPAAYRYLMDWCIDTYHFGTGTEYGVRIEAGVGVYYSTRCSTDVFGDYGYWFNDNGDIKPYITMQYGYWLSNKIPPTRSAAFSKVAPFGDWTGYVRGITVNGRFIGLGDLPGIRFTDVVRYELDSDGEIIESTATTLNT